MADKNMPRRPAVKKSGLSIVPVQTKHQHVPKKHKIRMGQMRREGDSSTITADLVPSTPYFKLVEGNVSSGLPRRPDMTNPKTEPSAAPSSQTTAFSHWTSTNVVAPKIERIHDSSESTCVRCSMVMGREYMIMGDLSGNELCIKCYILYLAHGARSTNVHFPGIDHDTMNIYHDPESLANKIHAGWQYVL